jgi:heptosyltransferase-2
MRILIVKIGAIGDVVMSLPMLTYLKNQYPLCKITCVCGSVVAPMFAATGMLDELIVVDEQKLLTGTKVFSLLSIWKRLFLRRFDLVLTAHPDLRYRLISLTVRAKERRNWIRSKIPTDHAREYLRLAGAPDAVPIIYPHLERVAMGGFSFPFIAIAPGGARNVLNDNPLRRWPIDRYAELIEQIVALGLKVVVTGSASDVWVRKFLPKGLYIDLIGQCSLLDTIDVYRESKLLITHDSGPLHLAKIAGCEVIALFGPTNPAEFAVGSKIDVIWGGKGLACRPCYNGKTFAACSSNLCLQSISVHQVVQRVQQKLEAKKQPLRGSKERLRLSTI